MRNNYSDVFLLRHRSTLINQKVPMRVVKGGTAYLPDFWSCSDPLSTPEDFNKQENGAPTNGSQKTRNVTCHLSVFTLLVFAPNPTPQDLFFPFLFL